MPPAHVLILKEYRPEMAMQVSLVAGVIMLLVVNRIVGAVNVITETAVAAGINLVYLQTLLRVIGIAYLAEFGAQICRDAGEGSIASRVELAAKVIILVMAVPVIVEIMESVLRMIPDEGASAGLNAAAIAAVSMLLILTAPSTAAAADPLVQDLQSDLDLSFFDRYWGELEKEAR